MDKPEIIETNTCGYIKVDKLFINDVKDLKEEYLKIKESIINVPMSALMNPVFRHYPH
jgi:hypothetical protein